MLQAMPSESERVKRFVELYANHQLGLLSYIIALVPKIEDAEDILQEVARVAWENFSTFEPGTSFLAWARKIAFLRVLEYRRRAQRGEVAFPEDVLEHISARASEASSKVMSEEYDALRQCLDGLRAPDRELIAERYMNGGRVKDIAERLGRPFNSVAKSLERIRGVLLECIERRVRARERKS